jgi:hypothetical protein
MILICLVLALCLSRVQYAVSKFNQKAIWNGLGAIPSIQAKTADAPMVYRVLAAWILRGRVNTNSYEILRLGLMWITLYSLYLAWGLPVMLIAAILITATLYFDYWDWMPELIGFSLALVSFPLALLGVAMHGLSRETAPLVGLVYALHFRDLWGGLLIALAGAVIMFLTRKIQGNHPLYCKRWMIKDNVTMLLHPTPPFILSPQYISLVLCALAGAGAWARADGLIVPLLIGAGWTMAKGNETRVFAGILPYAALFLSRVIA